LPARRRLLWVPAIFVTMLTAGTALMVGAKMNVSAFGFIALLWALGTLYVQRFIAEGFFPTTLHFNGSDLIFTRPTLFGMTRAVCDQWAIAGLRVSPNAGNRRASMELDRRGGQPVLLFD